jgi:hypothetical protein
MGIKQNTKDSKLRSNVNWPEVLEEDGIKQGLGVLPFPNANTLALWHPACLCTYI